MKQLVHNVSYLAKSILNLSSLVADEPTKAIALPANAEILHISVEVLTPSDGATTLDVGLEGDNEFFDNDLDLSKLNAQYTSAKSHCVKSTGAITITTNAKSDKGQIAIRAFYFLPSTILTEY